MKTSLNIFCAILLAIMACEVAFSLYGIFSGPGSIRQVGFAQVDMVPDEVTDQTSVTVTDPQGKEVKVWPTSVLVQDEELAALPAQEKTVLFWATVIGVGLILIPLALALVWFIKFIVNVNRGVIFDWKNVRLLRKTGWFYVIISLVFIVLLQIIHQTQSPVMAHYSINTLVELPDFIMTLSDGFLFLLMAEIFAVGLKQKEELDAVV